MKLLRQKIQLVQRTTGYRFCASAFHHDFALSILVLGTFPSSGHRGPLQLTIQGILAIFSFNIFFEVQFGLSLKY